MVIAAQLTLWNKERRIMAAWKVVSLHSDSKKSYWLGEMNAVNIFYAMSIHMSSNSNADLFPR